MTTTSKAIRPTAAVALLTTATLWTTPCVRAYRSARSDSTRRPSQSHSWTSRRVSTFSAPAIAQTQPYRSKATRTLVRPPPEAYSSTMIATCSSPRTSWIKRRPLLACSDYWMSTRTTASSAICRRSDRRNSSSNYSSSSKVAMASVLMTTSCFERCAHSSAGAVAVFRMRRRSKHYSVHMQANNICIYITTYTRTYTWLSRLYVPCAMCSACFLRLGEMRQFACPGKRTPGPPGSRCSQTIHAHVHAAHPATAHCYRCRM